MDAIFAAGSSGMTRGGTNVRIPASGRARNEADRGCGRLTSEVTRIHGAKQNEVRTETQIGIIAIFYFDFALLFSSAPCFGSFLFCLRFDSLELDFDVSFREWLLNT